MEFRVLSTEDSTNGQRSAQNSVPIVGIPILRPSSMNASLNSPRNSNASPKSETIVQGNVSFADDNGGRLVENHFVENLHYSIDASQRNAPLPACCTIS